MPVTDQNMLVPRSCPVCAHAVAAPFFDGGLQPLATLGWPRSAAKAQEMPRYALNFVQCPRCTHVWNASFSYDAIPYEKNPNRMFNAGSIWQGHLLRTRELVRSRLPDPPTVVEIGCGEGHFLRGLAESYGRGRFLGFDPNGSIGTGRGVEFHSRYFRPLEDAPAIGPDMIIMRHVLEHLTDPLSFVEQLAWGAAALDKPVWFFAEMPCIDRVFQTSRLADFFYEHPSHFTTRSFRTLMEHCGEIIELGHGYDSEVVYALSTLRVPAAMRDCAGRAIQFSRQAAMSRERICSQVNELAKAEMRVAVWGGTGKAAAFIHQFGVDARRFPLVVDSDPEKVGTFVPGSGQEIVFRDVLKAQPVDVVIIPTQWRAKDIVEEMRREGILAKKVLIEHEGQLVDFATAPHPYR